MRVKKDGNVDKSVQYLVNKLIKQKTPFIQCRAIGCAIQTLEEIIVKFIS
jgi:hypothetical protein